MPDLEVPTVDSPLLARHVESAFEDDIPETACEVHLGDDAKLDRRGDEMIQLNSEPEIGLFEKRVLKVLGWLPIQWRL